MKYEILEHKADLEIRAFGETKEELFLNMLFAMSENMKPKLEKPEGKTKREIRVKSLDLPTLLVDFLSEALYLSQVNKEVYFDVKFKKFSDTPHHPDKSEGTEQAELEGELIGQKIESSSKDIKAVTYHNLDIHQKEDGVWEATVLFDI